jgi:hypothetical protein
MREQKMRQQKMGLEKLKKFCCRRKRRNKARDKRHSVTWAQGIDILLGIIAYVCMMKENKLAGENGSYRNKRR